MSAEHDFVDSNSDYSEDFPLSSSEDSLDSDSSSDYWAED